MRSKIATSVPTEAAAFFPMTLSLDQVKSFGFTEGAPCHLSVKYSMTDLSLAVEINFFLYFLFVVAVVVI